MRLLFISEARLYRDMNGQHYCKDQSFSYKRFERYLRVYSRVIVVARVKSIGHYSDQRIPGAQVEGKHVSVLPLPYYVGSLQYLVNRKKVHGLLRKYISAHPSAAVICAIPGIIAMSAAMFLKKTDRRYGLEVVGDPYDVFSPGAIKHPLRPLLRIYFSRYQKTLVKHAAATIYVTKKYLQARYPPGKDNYSINASNVNLPPTAYVKKLWNVSPSQPFQAIAIGSLAKMYKGPDVAVKMISLLKRKGMHVNLLWLGDGAFRSKLITMAKRYGVANRVTFLGVVESTKEVQRYLDESDLFLMPSKTEGLPRALIEAMARGRPCIGTHVGGIPELLDKQAMVPKNNPEKLACKVERFLLNPNFLKQQAERNLKVAKNYSLIHLEKKRTAFYEKLKSLSFL